MSRRSYFCGLPEGSTQGQVQFSAELDLPPEAQWNRILETRE
jgi:hypothetical protein